MNDRAYASLVRHVADAFRYVAQVPLAREKPRQIPVAKERSQKWLMLQRVTDDLWDHPRGRFAKELANLYAWCSEEQREELEYRATSIGIDVNENMSYVQCELLVKELEVTMAERNEPEATPL